MTNNKLRRMLFDAPDQEINFVGEFSDDYDELFFIADHLTSEGLNDVTVEEVRTAIFCLENQDAKVNSSELIEELESIRRANYEVTV